MPRPLPDEPPPLVDLEQPLELFEEPDDEEERRALSPGSFTGIEVGSARLSLSEEEPPGLLVRAVIENSPADVAGIREGDLLLGVVLPDGEERALTWPGEWREIEVETPPGEEITVVFDRAATELAATVRLLPRVRSPGRTEAERLQEAERIGLVIRTATEVEARRVGLGPGGGAVVVGLSRRSPWREAGIRFGDLVVEIEGKAVDHPQVVLNAIREASGSLSVTLVRDGKRKTVETALTRRRQQVREIRVLPLFDYDRDRDEVELSILLGLIRYEQTAAAWQLRILWLLRFGGGDADRLVEVDNPR